MDLSANAQEIFDASMTYMDNLYDPQAGLLGQPEENNAGARPNRHMVRESTYYALGLLMRAGSGDAQLAEHILRKVLDNQIDEPQAPYHGTFFRYPQEARPTQGAREWRDYDPNWREFIGTGLALILTHFESGLNPGLVTRIDQAFRLAVEGALARNLNPGYTNIALMDAFLLHYAGQRLGVPDWLAAGERMAQQVTAIFTRHDAFEEYNSPTYYGADLYALGLWRGYAQSAQMRASGAQMEASMWADTARFYHAGLRNQCGPWDRSYGMDMTRYIGLLGVWVWLSSGQALAPVPDMGQPFDHAADLCFGPCAALVGTLVPDDAVRHLLAFQGARRVEQRITDTRVASAWLEEDLMLGAEHTQRSKPGGAQFHPFTFHWRLPDGQIGWVRLIHSLPVDVVAAERQLTLAGQGAMQFEIYAPGTQPEDIAADAWRLPGLQVAVSGSLNGCSAQIQRLDPQASFTITYPADPDQEAAMQFTVTPNTAVA